MEQIIEIMERIQQYQQSQKNNSNTNTETYYDNQKDKQQGIKWHRMYPNKPITEGVCPICGGTGVLIGERNGYECAKSCICEQKEIALRRLKKSGIAESVEKYTFDSFQTLDEWQKILKQKALQFLDETGKWFFVGGQVGCGKTHIYTAILGEFLNRGKSVKYIIWTSEIVKLKANKMDDVTYQNLMNPLLTTEVLYIDDFFKTEKGKRPSEADIKTAFEIINYRYVNSDLITIISCEKTIDDLIEIDEAIGSRIHQKTKGYRNVIKQEKGRNWRLRD